MQIHQFFTVGNSTIEILSHNDNSSFVQYVDMPMVKYDHTLVNIDEERLMLVSGHFLSGDSYVFDTNGGIWENGPFLHNGRLNSQVGRVTFMNGSIIIMVASGEFDSTTEINNLEEESQWRFGPQLPHSIMDGGSVQLANTFIIAGGFKDGFEVLDTIWIFDTDYEEWKLLDVQLKTTRLDAAAFLVPDDFC